VKIDPVHAKMNYSHLVLVGLFIEVAIAVSAKNFIYIVPDGYGPASQTLARDYASLLLNGENPKRPVTYQLPVDKLVSFFQYDKHEHC
jgi:alkaline phosphatase